jgi:hypothetical protein
MTGTARGEPVDLENDYAARSPWAKILKGWIFVRSDSGGERWDPPDRDSGHAPGTAVTRENGPMSLP